MLFVKGKMLQCNITSTSQEDSPRWSLVTGLTFSRDSHAAAVFKDKIWIVGGVSTSYYTQRLEQTTTRSDIVWTADGTVWTEVLEEAPFRRRFGHTLTTFKDEKNGDERLTLIGGFSPEPATDIWTSSDGATWVETTAKVPWSGRGYHCTVVFDRKLWIMGGSPLNNDVWFTNSVTNGAWTKQTAVPWSPRAAHGCAAHKVVTNVTIGDSSIRNYLFVIGGWDETSINDVWRMDITGNWTQLLEHAPWKPRGWHSVVSFDSRVHFEVKHGPRLWVIGGGIIGKGVEKMFPHSDVWYTRDGITWEMASSDASGVSTAEWSVVSTRDKEVCTGKWGHAVVPFYRRVKSCYYCGESCVTEGNTTILANQIIPVCKPDTDQPDPPIQRTVMRNGSMQTRTLYPDQCGLCLAGSNARFVASTTVPALYLIAGNVGTQKVKDVFVSGDAMLCERDGVLCSNNGTCTLGGTCLCISGKQGQFCELDLDYTVVDNKNCFPDVAMVTTPQGKRAMRDIVPGDSVFAFDTASGNLVFSPVYYIPHDASQHLQIVFVQMYHMPICSDMTHATRLLEITPSHLLYVVAPEWKTDFTSSDGCNETSNHEIYKYVHQKPAKDISVGDLLVVAYPVETRRIALSRVVSLDHVRQPGAMTLYTMTGNFFVEGVLSSNFADLYPHLNFDKHRDWVPFALFQPHRLIYTLFPYSSTSHWLRQLMDTLLLPLLHNLF